MALEILEADLGGEPVTADELAAIPDFASIKKEIWARFPGMVARKIYRPGEIIFREGDNGTTAFYILEGSVEVFINNQVVTSQTRRKTETTRFPGLSKLASYLTGVPDRSRKVETVRTHIPFDGPVDLPMSNPVATIEAGDLFGELAALEALKQERTKRPKVYPRSATVRARTQVTVLEMLPNILNKVLYVSPAFKTKLDQKYRTRALDSHLRAVPLLRNLSPEFLEHLRQNATLEDVRPGEVICREGDPAEAFYLIRLGFVKVSQAFPGGEMVLTYLSRGSYFGEMALLPQAFRLRAQGDGPGQFAEATVAREPVKCGRAPSGDLALAVTWDEYISREHFEMRSEGEKVRITRLPGGKNPIIYRTERADSFLVTPGESFQIGNTKFEVLEDSTARGKRTATCTAMDYVQLVKLKASDFAEMRQKFPEVDSEITEVARVRRQARNQMLSRIQTVSLDSFLNQELMQGQNLLLLDLDKCVRCDECSKACASTHEDGIPRLLREGLRFERYLVPTSCRACLDPMCMTSCPVGSIRRKETLDIVIEDWCIGCNQCAENCPYGSITLTALPGRELPKATVCDLCAEYPEPNCVRACPHDAALRVEPKKFFAQDLAGIQLAIPDDPKAERRAIPQEAFETRIQSNIQDLVPFLPRLKVITGERAGTMLKLNYQGETVFGRSGEADYSFPDDTNMSRRHSSIRCVQGRFFVKDLGSTNGTYVNGVKTVGEVELHAGDVISLSDVQFEFLWGPSA